MNFENDISNFLPSSNSRIFLHMIFCVHKHRSMYNVDNNANSVDPDQTPHSAASNQDLLCLARFYNLSYK